MDPQLTATTSDQSASIEAAQGHKEEGNTYFRAQEHDQALFAYRRGLECLPMRDEPIPSPVDPDEAAVPVDEPAALDPPDRSPPNEMEKARAVLNANIAACHVKLVSQPFLSTRRRH